jgi:hypothetical protein
MHHSEHRYVEAATNTVRRSEGVSVKGKFFHLKWIGSVYMRQLSSKVFSYVDLNTGSLSPNASGIFHAIIRKAQSSK